MAALTWSWNFHVRKLSVGFFRSGCPSGCPAWLITQSTSGQQFYSPLQTVRSPTGMLGLNLAHSRTVVVCPLLPAPVFDQHGSILVAQPASSRLEACISARPFTPPQRLSSFENRLGGIAAPGLYLRMAYWTLPRARSIRSSPPLPLLAAGEIHCS
jgi:hypothetical protein